MKERVIKIEVESRDPVIPVYNVKTHDQKKLKICSPFIVSKWSHRA